MGTLADPEIFSTPEIAPLGFEASASGGLQHWKTIRHVATHIPEFCWGENAVNEFQKRQCLVFWERLEFGTLLSLLPFLFLVLFWIVAFRSLKKIYERAGKRLQSPTPVASGIVTEPVGAPQDLFSWTYGFRPIGLQMATGKQIKIYLAEKTPLPRPGQTFVIYAPIYAFGSPRHFGLLYAPHIAVVSGTRRK